MNPIRRRLTAELWTNIRSHGEQQREVKPRRRAISASVQNAVLKEFNDRCALCGEDRPQVHHIDENSANTDSLNLLPCVRTAI